MQCKVSGDRWMKIKENQVWYSEKHDAIYEICGFDGNLVDVVFAVREEEYVIYEATGLIPIELFDEFVLLGDL